MNTRLVKKLYNWVQVILDKSDLPFRKFLPKDIINIQNGIIRLSESIAKIEPYFSRELFRLKDVLFINSRLNSIAFGAFIAIINYLYDKCENPQEDVWAVIHPSIVKSSKKLYLDGYYANAACDAFIEINSRVKKIFEKVKPGEKVPDGDPAMTCVFSTSEPLVAFCDRTNDTGKNTQKGYMQMLAGSMSALRNPKAHENIDLSKDEAFRRLMFASMLMYKIDEGIKFSQIEE
jgi:uncharacterized protein (TIGR02391 family)